MNRWILSTSLAALAGGSEAAHQDPHSAGVETRVVHLQHGKATRVALELEALLGSRREFEDLDRDLALGVQPDNRTNSVVLSCPGRIPEWVVASIDGLDRERKRTTHTIHLNHAQAADVQRRCLETWAVKSPAFLAWSSGLACVMPGIACEAVPFEPSSISEVMEDLPRFEVDMDSNSLSVSGFDSRQLRAALDRIAELDEGERSR